MEERPALLYGGAQDNYTWRAEDGVFSFLYAANDGYETESYQRSPPPNDTIIIFYQRGPGVGPNGTSGEHVAELYRKTDDGLNTSGTQITPHQGFDPERFSKPIYKSPATGKFYVGQNDLYWSDDDGDNYPYVAGLSAGGFNNNQNAVSAFDVSQQDENRIYVAYNASGDYQGNQQYRRQLYFNDEADGWISISPSLLSNPNTDICSDYLTCFQQITGVVSDPKNFNRVWITLSDRWSNFERDPNDWFSLKPYRESAVYYSDSSGLPGTWHAMSTGLPNFYVHCIVYQKGTDDVLYVGTYVG